MTNPQAASALDGVAIIGMAGRFPGANNIGEFWRNLLAGVESISWFDPDRLERSVLDDPASLDDARYVPVRGILDGVELFDAGFFGINPTEAQVLDPQQRLFLEAAWEALEQAGYVPEACRGVVGVFAGMSNNTYFAANLQGRRDVTDLVGALQTMMANEKDYLATRVSYKLDLKGPSVNVQTACSTSLVAICQAAQSLLAYQCDMALAGGVSIALPQRRGYLCYDGAITSPDGHCRAFDARAQGTVFSNGLGVVVLKRLADAVADGDRVSAVIKGLAVNNDGSGKVSFLAPSVDGHADAVAMAQAFARTNARDVTFVEAHGTGTALGDVVEVAALTQAFRLHTAAKGFCALGSVKTNIGHLDAAAGVAGLIKAALALQHRVIPPTLHFTAPNPKLSLDETPFFVNTAPLEWSPGSAPRQAGVSSLGAGGTNAHVVLEEAPETEPSGTGRGVEIVVLSARTAAALDRATENLRDFLESHPDTPLADVAYTLQVGRRRFSHRRAIVCRDRQDAVGALRERASRRVVTGSPASTDAPLAFVFPAAAAIPQGRARELYDREPVFRDSMNQCAAALNHQFGVEDLLRASAGQQHAPTSVAAGPAIGPVALFAIEYALSQLWMHWGVKPSLTIAGGVGEYVAATIAGVFSPEDALALVARLADGQHRADSFPQAKAPKVPVLSAITGEWLTAEQAARPEYWIGALRRARRAREVHAPLPLPSSVLPLVLVPPHGECECARALALADGIQAALPTLCDRRTALDSMFETLATVWLNGADVDWRRLHAGERRLRVALPTYPFERERYWIDPIVAPTPLATQPLAADSRQPLRPTSAGAWSDSDCAARLTTLISELSGLPETQLDRRATFFELGLDSLFLTQAAAAVYKTFGVKVTFSELLEELNSIGALAERLARAVPAEVARRNSPAASDSERAAPAAAAIRGEQNRPLASATPAAHGPFRPIEKASTVPTAAQQRALDALVDRYTARTAESKRLTGLNRPRLADPRTVAGFRGAWKEIVYPIVVVRSAGSKLWDVDGHEYVDLVNGFGTNLFGHSPAFVTAALEAQLKRGIEIGPQTPLAGSVATLACEMTGHERVAFCNTGSEAVTAAIRMARTVTGRDTIVMFSGAYHGTFDEALSRGTTVRGELRAAPIAPGIPASACGNVLVLEYGSAAALDVLRSRASDLAAVLVEPVQSRRPELQPVRFLRDVRQITDKAGAALVFDEVVSGFRVHPGGVQALFGIKADLATYGKVVGGGLPIGLVAGSAKYLDTLDGGGWQYGDSSFPTVGMTFFAGTFVRHPLALAAAAAVLQHLKAEGSELQRRLNLRTTALVETLNDRAKAAQAPVSVAHFASWFCFRLPSELPYAPLFYACMRSRGIHVWEGRPGFITTAHTDQDLERVVDAFTETIAEMQEAGFLPSAEEDVPPVAGARRGKHPDGREGWFLPDPNRPGMYLEVGNAG